jgi:multiple sugar transport system ATP-binding protein
MAALSVRGVHKRFGPVEVLKGIDLTVENGEFAVLLGPSGCGKSTLLAVVAGLERPSAGTVEIGDRVVNDIEPKDRDIAMVFQSYALYPAMTVRGNITFGMECRGVPKQQQNEAVARVAGLLQIDGLLERKPAQLSGGQRQRVAMGRALVRDPLLFLFDEPLSNLDAKLRVDMRIKRLPAHQRHIVSHAPTRSRGDGMASRIAVWTRAIQQQFDSPEIVYNRPARHLFPRSAVSRHAAQEHAGASWRHGGAVEIVSAEASSIRPLPLPAETPPSRLHRSRGRARHPAGVHFRRRQALATFPPPDRGRGPVSEPWRDDHC